MNTDVTQALASALRDGGVRAIDLTHPLSSQSPIIELPPPFHNTPGWSLQEVSRYDDRGPWFYWNAFSGSEHMGTHFDAPVHWITGRDGVSVDQVTPAQLIGPAVVIDGTQQVGSDNDYLLDLDLVKAFESKHGPVPAGGWVLFRTGWASRYTDASEFLLKDDDGHHWPGMTAECARYLAHETEILGYGVEQVGIDGGAAHEQDPPYPAHNYLLGAGKFGLAQLANLDQLPETGAILFAAPLRIVGGSGSPARIVALVGA